MTDRTTFGTVTFARPFVLGDFASEFPAGTYDIETSEELLDGLSFVAYRRVSIILHLPPSPMLPGLRQSVSIEPNRLDEILKRDQAAAAPQVAGDLP